MKRLISLMFLMMLWGGMAAAQQFNVTQTDLRQVRVDELSDDQVRQFISWAQSTGMSYAQLEVEAANRGMPQTEIQKLRARINALEAEVVEEQAEVFESRDPEDHQREVAPDPGLSARVSGAGVDLGIFGRGLLTFEPSLNIPTPKDYILGAGDQLIIEVWGASRNSYDVTVRPEGYIRLDNLGNIYVNGLTIERATALIINRLSSIYSGLRGANPNTFAQVTLGKVRSIKVTIAGESMLPGTYTVPSLATAFNALYLSGGPGPKGSFRSIRVIRNHKVVADIDLYEFMTDGDTRANIRLEDQDLIFVTTYKNRVDIGGEVKRPATYELLDHETLTDLIRYAGGFSERAYTHRIKIIRKTDIQQEILDVEAPLFSHLKLKNGDQVSVAPILDRIDNRVSIQGAVFRPGDFAWRQGMTLTQLIAMADGLREDVFLHRASIFRRKPDMRLEALQVDLGGVLQGEHPDVLLQEYDVVNIGSIFSIEQQRTVQIIGEVANPKSLPYHENITLGDLVLNAGGLLESASLARVEVARRVTDQEATLPSMHIAEIFGFGISQNLELTDDASAFVLQPFDMVFVRRSPGYFTQKTVSINGEVAFPGSYVLASNNERISDLIARAGGLTQFAYLPGATLMRQASQAGVEGGGTKFVGVDFPDIMRRPGTKGDLFLMQGDAISIPRELQTVTLNGAVMFPLTTRYSQNKSLRGYVSEAGGFADNAHRRRVYVQYPNGMNDRTRSFLFVHSYPSVEPGSQIVVPVRPEKERRQMTSAEWAAISSSMATIAAMVVYILSAIK